MLLLDPQEVPQFVAEITRLVTDKGFIEDAAVMDMVPFAALTVLAR
jgi:hypothetical protein